MEKLEIEIHPILKKAAREHFGAKPDKNLEKFIYRKLADKCKNKIRDNLVASLEKFIKGKSTETIPDDKTIYLLKNGEFSLNYKEECYTVRIARTNAKTMGESQNQFQREVVNNLNQIMMFLFDIQWIF